MILSTFLSAVAQILHMFIQMYIWIVIIAALITWVKPDPYNQLVQALYKLTQPVYTYIRKYIPTIFGGIDLAPLIIIFALQFIDMFFVRLLVNFANAI
ncbi:MAG: YggT family protein [Campylobacteraceae bacterium]|nr:YggT family protein [Campylobacteraceae bacterium]